MVVSDNSTDINYFILYQLICKILGQKAFKCPKCSKGYKLKTSLHNHTKYECGKSKSFVCDQCHRGFYYKQALKLHVDRKTCCAATNTTKKNGPTKPSEVSRIFPSLTETGSVPYLQQPYLQQQPYNLSNQILDMSGYNRRAAYVSPLASSHASNPVGFGQSSVARTSFVDNRSSSVSSGSSPSNIFEDTLKQLGSLSRKF